MFVACSTINFTVRKAALPRCHKHGGGSVCKCVGYDELQMCCFSSLLDYRHLLSKCRAVKRSETLLKSLMYCHHTHIYTYKHILKLCLESYTVTLLLLYLLHSVCKLCGVCKFALCMESQGDILHLPKYIQYLLTHCLEYCIPECYVQLTIEFSFPKLNSK